MGLLRFLLASAVVAVHSSQIMKLHMVSGMVAVQSFFIISGFYMTLILNEKYIGENNSYKLFITNRFLRIYPIYIIVLLLTAGVSFLHFLLYKNASDLEPYIQNNTTINTALVLIISNILIFGQDVLMFLSINPIDGTLFLNADLQKIHPTLFHFLFVPQAWTISLELMFYLIAPYILRKKNIYIFFLIILSFSVRFFLYTHGLNKDPWTYRFFPTELGFFLLGAVSYILYKKIEYKNIPNWFYVMILSSIVVITLTFDLFPTYLLKIYLYYSCIVIFCPFLFVFTKKNKIDRYIGELSYPIYISHMFLLMIVGTNYFPKIESLGTTLLIITILFSIFLNTFISFPLERWRQFRLKLVSNP